MSYRKPKANPDKPAWRGKFMSDDFCMPPYLERSILSSSITSGLPYQRPVREKDVDALIAKWDPLLNDPVIINQRDGKNNLVDGQHRIAAMRKMCGGRDIMVRCRVLSGLTYEQEAALCYKLDKAKRRLTLSQSVMALSESGEDHNINAIKEIVEGYGFRWALKDRGCRDNTISATRATISAYKDLKYQAFSRMMKLIKLTWDGSAASLTSYIISGMALFLKTYAFEMDDNLFVKQLSKVDPQEIIQRGKLDFSTRNNALRYAKVILERYNARQPRKLPYRFS